MTPLKHNPNTLLVIDLDRDAILTGSFTKTRNSLTGKFHEETLPDGAVQNDTISDPASITAALEESVRALGHTGRDAHVLTLDRHTILQAHEMPTMPAAQLEKALPHALAALIQAPLTENLAGFITGISTKQNMSGFMIGYSRLQATELLRLHHAVGLVTQGFTPRAIGAANAFLAANSSSAGLKLVAHVSRWGTSFVLFQATTPLMARITPVGYHDTHRADGINSWVEQLDATLEGHRTGIEPITLHLSGHNIMTDELASHLEQRNIAPAAHDFEGHLDTSLSSDEASRYAHLIGIALEWNS